MGFLFFSNDIFKVVEAGKAKKLQKIINKGVAEINTKNESGQTPLHIVKNAEIAEILIDNGAVVTEKDKLGHSPLLCVNNIDIAKLLVSKGGDINEKDSNGASLIHLVAERGNIEILEWLCDMDIDINSLDNNKQTPLHYAAINFEYDTVKFLVEKGANPNIEDNQKNTPILNLIFNDKLNNNSLTAAFIAQHLIENGASVLCYNIDGVDFINKLKRFIHDNFEMNKPLTDALNSAIREQITVEPDKILRIFFIIEKEDKKFNANKANLILQYTKINPKLGGLIKKYIEDEKISISYILKKNFTEGIQTIEEMLSINDHTKFVQLITDEDNSQQYMIVTIYDRKGTSYPKTVNYPINISVNEDLSRWDSTKENELCTAVKNGDLDLLKSYLEMPGCNPDSKSEDVTALMFAAHFGHISIIKELIQHGANLDLTNNNGWTALMAACSQGHDNVVKELISAGADTNPTDIDGFNALMLARKVGSDTCAMTLRNAGAKLAPGARWCPVCKGFIQSPTAAINDMFGDRDVKIIGMGGDSTKCQRCGAELEIE